MHWQTTQEDKATEQCELNFTMDDIAPQITGTIGSWANNGGLGWQDV